MLVNYFLGIFGIDQRWAEPAVTNTNDRQGRCSLFHCLEHSANISPSGRQRPTGQKKMADGVDHIDIYADVEEEFSQVILQCLICFAVSCLIVEYFGIGVIGELVARLQLVLNKRRPLFAMLPVHLCEDCVLAIFSSSVNDNCGISCT